MKVSVLVGMGLAFSLIFVSTADAQKSLPGRSWRRAPAAATIQAAPPPVVASPGASAQAVGPRLSSFSWDLYIDAEARMPSRDTLLDRGFTLNDGALYMTKDFGQGVRGLVELAFSSEVSSAANGVQFDEERAQAFVEFQRWAPLLLRFGQYNSFLGVEANDSRDRFFADYGLIKGLLLPKTHTGVQMGYQTPQVVFLGQIANPGGRSNMSSVNPELGVYGRFQVDKAYGALGVSVNDQNAPSNINRTNTVFDITGGWSNDNLRIDGELAFTKAAGSDRQGSSVGVHSRYALTSAFSVGGRFEYLSNSEVPATAAPQGAYDTIYELSVGPSYQFQPDLIFRGDFSLANFKSSTFSDTITVLTASMVASF